MVNIFALVNACDFLFGSDNYITLKSKNGLFIGYAYTSNDYRMHERYRWWHGNGQISVDADYKNGELHGQHRVWDENGNLTADEVWENGKLVRG